MRTRMNPRLRRWRGCHVIAPPRAEQGGDVVLFVLGASCNHCGQMHERATHDRLALRDFLRIMSREEPATRFRLVRPDQVVVGEVTRAHLSAAIDRLYLRRRQVVRLCAEQGQRRAVIAERLHVSLKTLERDYREALDTLWRLVLEHE